MAGRLGEADVARHDGVEGGGPEMGADLALDVPGQVHPVVVHGEQDAVDLEARIEARRRPARPSRPARSRLRARSTRTGGGPAPRRPRSGRAPSGGRARVGSRRARTRSRRRPARGPRAVAAASRRARRTRPRRRPAPGWRAAGRGAGSRSAGPPRRPASRRSGPGRGCGGRRLGAETRGWRCPGGRNRPAAPGARAPPSAAARLIAVVVLPTPPFWFATARIRVIAARAGGTPAGSDGRCRPARPAAPRDESGRKLGLLLARSRAGGARPARASRRGARRRPARAAGRAP